MHRLDHIIDAYREDPDSVLGTVVDLRGSGYRRPGARILIRRDGSYTGAISGGCLEKDVARNAWNWIEDGPETVAFDTRANEFHPAGQYGTGCDGIVKARLLGPGEELEAQMSALAEAQEAGRPLVSRHHYAGESALIDEIDTDAIEQEAYESERSIGVRIVDGARSAELLFEYIAPPLDLLIFGAGDDAAALVEVAEPLGWRPRVASTDPLKLREKFGATKTHELPHGQASGELEIHPDTRVVIMTHAFEFDVEALPGVLESDARWVGILGPKTRTGRLFAEILERGGSIPADGLDKIRSPVGLDIGGEDPWQVAVSIVAQIIADSNERAGGDLASRKAPIHDPHELRIIDLRR